MNPLLAHRVQFRIFAGYLSFSPVSVRFQCHSCSIWPAPGSHRFVLLLHEPHSRLLTAPSKVEEPSAPDDIDHEALSTPNLISFSFEFSACSFCLGQVPCGASVLLNYRQTCFRFFSSAAGTSTVGSIDRHSKLKRPSFKLSAGGSAFSCGVHCSVRQVLSARDFRFHRGCSRLNIVLLERTGAFQIIRMAPC